MASSAGSEQCCGGQLGTTYQGLSSCLLGRNNFSVHLLTACSMGMGLLLSQGLWLRSPGFPGLHAWVICCWQ